MGFQHQMEVKISLHNIIGGPYLNITLEELREHQKMKSYELGSLTMLALSNSQGTKLSWSLERIPMENRVHAAVLKNVFVLLYNALFKHVGAFILYHVFDQHSTVG